MSLRRNRKLLVLGGALLCLLIAVLMVRRVRASAPAHTYNGRDVVSAAIAIAKRAPIGNSYSVAGEFLPYQEIEVHAKVAGYIRRINVDIGDRVKTGQVLAVLEVPELVAELQGAGAGVRHSQQEILRAQNEVDRDQAQHAALHANESNLILPAGDVRIGPKDYNLYTNSQLPSTDDINRLPLKSVGNASVLVGDVGRAMDAQQIQTSIVRVDGQKSVYLPVLKQGGDSNTIAIVSGIKSALGNLVDVPKSLVAKVVFDQSVYVKTAIRNLGNEGGIGLVLTALMILIFLGSVRATVAVLLSIPLSALAAFMAINLSGGTVNTMVLGGLALVFSRLIDNSVVVLENIFRHLEEGESPEVAAERGGQEVGLPVLAATFTTAIVFFPVVFLYGVSRFLFTALAASVIFSLFASYMVAMTVVPLFCARFLKGHGSVAHHGSKTSFARFVNGFNHRYDQMLMHYDIAVGKTLLRPAATVLGILGIFVFSLALYPLLGVSFFPRTDPGQFMINLKAPSGTRLEPTDQYVRRVEADIREVVSPRDLKLVLSNVGVTPGFSSMYTSNSGQHTATVQVSLNEGHKVGSYEYMDRVRRKLLDDMPELTSYFQSGGLVDAVINLGLPAPIDIQVSGSHLRAAYNTAQQLRREIRSVKGVSDVLIPQDLDYPALRLDVNREMASRLGLSSKEVVDNVITALTSNQMIAPSYWVDPRTGNDYMLTVQYPDSQIKTMSDLEGIPLRSSNGVDTTDLGAVTNITQINSPTEVDHYQLQQDAESLALRNNPQISVYRLLALASQQVTRETKSNYYPNFFGSVTAVEPREGSRIAAGGLNNPNRPEIAAQDYEYQASKRYQKAERDLLLPDIRVLGSVGGVPTGAPQLESWYGAVGVNVNIPIFNGFLYPARSREAALRVQASQEQLRDLKDRIANDVRTSWLNANAAYSRISVTQQFVDQTNLAADLSQTRYKLGLSSIVELSQAQLQQTEAQIQFAAAKYQYQIAQAVLRFQIAAP